MREIKEKYNPKNFEDRIYKNWEEKGYFKPNMNKEKDTSHKVYYEVMDVLNKIKVSNE